MLCFQFWGNQVQDRKVGKVSILVFLVSAKLIKVQPCFSLFFSSSQAREGPQLQGDLQPRCPLGEEGAQERHPGQGGSGDHHPEGRAQAARSAGGRGRLLAQEPSQQEAHRAPQVPGQGRERPPGGEKENKIPRALIPGLHSDQIGANFPTHGAKFMK